MNNMQSTFPVEYLVRGRYKVIDLLGQGTSGAVYLVTDERTPQRQCVLKEVRHVVGEERRSFPFDPAALKRLDHPSLPRVYQVFHGDDRDRFYIIMDYVGGSNLEVMRQLMPGKRFSFHAALTLMSPIMDAVSHLHRQHPPLIHGDIKPSNIILPISGTATAAKLVNFGGVKYLGTCTATQQHMLNFRAPEQFGKTVSRRTDVYALGAIFYTLLTGTVPAAAPDRLARIEAGEPDPLLPMNQFSPAGQIVARAIYCALSIHRRDRFDSVELFREALWQVMYANGAAAQAPELMMVVAAEEHPGPNGYTAGTESLELPVMVPAEDHTELATEPDDSTLGGEIPASIADVSIEATAAAASSEPSLWTEALFSQGGSPVLRRKKRRLHANGRAKGKARALSLVVRVLLLVCVIAAGVSIVGYQTYDAKYQNEVALAQVGIKHLQTAASLMQAWSNKPFDAPSVTSARHEFAAASAVFAQLHTDLQSFSGVGTSIPVFATRLSAATRLVSVAMKISMAGVAGCDALDLILSRFLDPFGTGPGLTTADLAAIAEDLRRVEANVNQANMQINTLQPGDVQFDSRVGKAIAAFHRYLPSLQALLHQTDQLLPVLPSLLGVTRPSFYLVEILDPTDQRPGGGAIRDYGFATFIGGRLSTAHITDVNLLDTHFTATGHTLSLPHAYGWFALTSQNWDLHDSNLDADFPTAANYGEQIYSSEGGRVPLQGVIAVTPAFIEKVLAITGPISVPELHETITERNLIDRIHYYELGPGKKGGRILLSPQESLSRSRYFTELLLRHLLARFHQVRSSILPELFQSLITSLRTKDLQLYFNALPAENLLRSSHVDAAIPASTGDSVFVVDANVADNTANQFITSTMNDRVTIDGSGNAAHRTTIRYTWLKNAHIFGSPLYSDYVRIYVPPGSSLQEQQGWQPRGTSQAFDREVWAGFFTLSYNQTVTVTLTWTANGIAKKDAAGWQYRYLIQRQAGTYWMLNLGITLPSCAVRTRTSGGLISHGQTATLTQSLTVDTNLGIDYRC